MFIFPKSLGNVLITNSALQVASKMCDDCRLGLVNTSLRKPTLPRLLSTRA